MHFLPYSLYQLLEQQILGIYSFPKNIIKNFKIQNAIPIYHLFNSLAQNYNMNLMNRDKKISIQQKNYSIFAILSSKQYNDHSATVPISLPSETLKPYRHKISNATYASPKQPVKFNIKAKLAQNVREFQRTKTLFSDGLSNKYQHNFKMTCAAIKTRIKRQVVPQQKEKKRNIRQYLHEIAKKNKRISSKFEANNYASDNIHKKNKFKTVLIVKNMSLDQKQTKPSLQQLQQQSLFRRNDQPIHQTYSYFFNRKKCRTQQNNRQWMGQHQQTPNMQRNKITIQQLCNLRQELKKCSESSQIFQKYRKRPTQPSSINREASDYTKEEIDDTINEIYDNFYRSSFERRKKKNFSFSANKEWGKRIKEQQISPWNKKVLEDNEFI